jgi:hypothetical protein
MPSTVNRHPNWCSGFRNCGAYYRTLCYLDIMICPLAIDRVYTGYAWYKHLTGNEIFFVTRLKFNAKIQVIKCPMPLRRIG